MPSLGDRIDTKKREAGYVEIAKKKLIEEERKKGTPEKEIQVKVAKLVSDNLRGKRV